MSDLRAEEVRLAMENYLNSRGVKIREENAAPTNEHESDDRNPGQVRPQPDSLDTRQPR